MHRYFPAFHQIGNGRTVADEGAPLITWTPQRVTRIAPVDEALILLAQSEIERKTEKHWQQQHRASFGKLAERNWIGQEQYVDCYYFNACPLPTVIPRRRVLRWCA